MVTYHINKPLEVTSIVRVFNASGISRPTEDLPRIERMFANSNLVVSAWDEDRLIGVGRALTDHSYCCYLSDLAIDIAYQKQGVGREIIRQIQNMIGEQVSLLLLSAPTAMSYYPKIGFARTNNAFIIRQKR